MQCCLYYLESSVERIKWYNTLCYGRPKYWCCTCTSSLHSATYIQCIPVYRHDVSQLAVHIFGVFGAFSPSCLLCQHSTLNMGHGTRFGHKNTLDTCDTRHGPASTPEKHPRRLQSIKNSRNAGRHRRSTSSKQQHAYLLVYLCLLYS